MGTSFTSTGQKRELDWLETKLEGKYELRKGRLGPRAEDAKELTVLNSVDFSNMALQPQQLLFRTSGSGGANTSKSKKGAGKNKKNRKKSKNKNRNNATDDVNSVAGEELRLRYRHLDLRRAESSG